MVVSYCKEGLEYIMHKGDHDSGDCNGSLLLCGGFGIHDA